MSDTTRSAVGVLGSATTTRRAWPTLGGAQDIGQGLRPDYPPEALARLAEIPEIVGLKEASFDTPKTVETIEAAAALPRLIGILTGSDTFIMEAMVMGCDGALIGFAGTATDQLIAMHRAVAAGEFHQAKEIWQRLGPLARFCWRPPIRLPAAHEGGAGAAGPDSPCRRASAPASGR